MTQSDSRSPFALMLEKLFDQTNLFDRSHWAEFLGLSPQGISLWTDDKAIPTAEQLRMVLGVLRENDHTPKEILDEFDVMSLRPFREISPHPDLNIRTVPIGPSQTVADYFLQPLFDGFVRLYSILPTAAKKEVLELASTHANELYRQSKSSDN